jgi:hypothetical protein
MSPTQPRSILNPVLAAWKELARMTRKLTRILDAMSHITIVILALYIGAATFGLGA